MVILIKVKEVNLSVYLVNEAPDHKDVWGSEDIAPLFLTPTLD
jgi:hypothetical protein